MRWPLAVFVSVLSTIAAADPQVREFTGGRLAAPPALDGKVDVEEYRGAIRLDGLVDSSTGVVSPEGGEFYLAFDDKFVYFAAKLIDQQPSRIQATEFRTNVSLNGNDTITLSLDPFDNLAGFNNFTMNARGATNIDIPGGRAAKREWLGDFVSKGRVTKEGWEVEARIPWNVMRLPAKGAHDIRFNVYRNHRRLLRNFAWSQTANGLVQNYGRWKSVDLPAAQAPTLQLLPYAYGGVDEKTGLVANSGLDLRYSLTPDLDLVGTINPDFRNVERGVLSLDFSYFERLANETRPFFLEGGRYFGSADTSGNGGPAIFTPQRIQNFDAGIKTFGKLNPSTDFGLMVTEDFGHQDAVVGRIQRQTGPRTNWSAQYAGTGNEGQRNDAATLGYGQGTGNWYLSGRLSGTHDDVVGSGHFGSLNGNYSHERSFLSFGYDETSKDYLPRLGFAPQVDNRGMNFFGGNTWLINKKGILQYRLLGSAAYYKTYDFQKPYWESAGFYPSITWRDGTRVGADLTYDRFFGGSHDQTYHVFLLRPDGDPYRRWIVSYTSGSRANAPYRNLNLGFAYRPLPTFQLNGSYQNTTYLGRTFDQTIVSANYDLDQYHSIGGRAIVSDRGTNWYLSFRQAGNRGAEYYLILGDPNAPKFRSSLILKAVFPVSFGL